jgi:3D (Asp-Asp-Asp) domain-containing protein/D-alanyl-D-alanine dipeptidase
MSSSSDRLQNSFDSYEPKQELESPFLNEEFLADEARIAQWRVPATGFQPKSPFLEAFEDGWGSGGVEEFEGFPDELDEDEFEEEEGWFEVSNRPPNGTEYRNYEMPLEWEDNIESFYNEEEESKHHEEFLLEFEAPPLVKDSAKSNPAGQTLYLNIDLELGKDQCCVKRECIKNNGKKCVQSKCIKYEAFASQPKTGIFIPENYISQAKVDLILYLHGHTCSKPGPNASISEYWDGSKYSIFALREAINDSKKNVILVAPTLGVKSKAGNLVLDNGLDNYVDKVLEALKIYGPYQGQSVSLGNLIIAAHSGGGKTMQELALSSNSYATKIVECWGLDSQYQDASPWIEWARKNPQSKYYSYYCDVRPTANWEKLLKPPKRNKKPIPQNIAPIESTIRNHFKLIKYYMRERLLGTQFLKSTQASVHQFLEFPLSKLEDVFEELLDEFDEEKFEYEGIFDKAEEFEEFIDEFDEEEFEYEGIFDKAEEFEENFSYSSQADAEPELEDYFSYPDQEESSKNDFPSSSGDFSIIGSDQHAWIFNLDKSAIELLPDSTQRQRFLEHDWTKVIYINPKEERSKWELSEELFNAMAGVIPERRVPKGKFKISYHNIDKEVVAVPGQSNCNGGICKLFPAAQEAFVTLNKAAAADGVDLLILSAWRDEKRQDKRRKQQSNPYAVANGISPHTYGLTVDLCMSVTDLAVLEMTTNPSLKHINSENEELEKRKKNRRFLGDKANMGNIFHMYRSPVYKWMALNGHKYGWFPYKREPWHWEYNPPGFKERFEGTTPKTDSKVVSAMPSQKNLSKALDLDRVVWQNQKLGKELGWDKYYDQISYFLGYTNSTPNLQAFSDAVYQWQQRQGMSADGIIGKQTWAKLRNAIKTDVAPASSTVPMVTDGKQPTSTRLTPPSDPQAYRKFRLTTYHMASEPTASIDALVPVLTSSGNAITNVPAGFFAEMALEGRGRLKDGRLLTGDGWTSSIIHDYSSVLAIHHRRFPKGNKYHDRTKVSGITVDNDKVTMVRAYAIVPTSQVGQGYGKSRGISLEPYRTVAADIGAFKNSDARYRGAWSDRENRYIVVNGKTGLVPTGTQVYIRQLDGVILPDGKRHDGWVIVNDTGGGIFGAHFDVFVGEKQRGEPFIQLLGGREVDVWFDGIEQRIPQGYTSGLT